MFCWGQMVAMAAAWLEVGPVVEIVAGALLLRWLLTAVTVTRTHRHGSQ